jgi:FHA domain
VRFRLHYLQHDLELRVGDFVIGRHATCQLSLDDPLVSRRHAVIAVTATDVSLEDLGSRNGVLLNGEKIARRVRLRPGDKVLIGSQEMTLVLVPELDPGSSAGRTTLAMGRVTPVAGETLPRMADDAETRVSYQVLDSVEELSVIKRIDGFRVLGSVAEKALAMGRADEAERMLAPSLSEVVDAIRKGLPIPLALAEQATRFAAKLATTTGKSVWGDYVIEVYSALERPAPAVVIDELYAAFRKVGTVDLAKLKAYVEMLRRVLPSFGPADRFLVQRIEGLERLVALRS